MELESEKKYLASEFIADGYLPQKPEQKNFAASHEVLPETEHIGEYAETELISPEAWQYISDYSGRFDGETDSWDSGPMHRLTSDAILAIAETQKPIEIFDKRLDAFRDDPIKMVQEAFRLKDIISGITFEAAVTKLEERGVNFADKAFLTKLMEEGDYLAQLAVLDIVDQYLEDKSFVDFIQGLASQFYETYERGCWSFENTYGEDSDETRSWLVSYAPVLFKKIGGLISKRVTPQNNAALTSAYAECIRRFSFYGAYERQIRGSSFRKFVAEEPTDMHERFTFMRKTLGDYTAQGEDEIEIGLRPSYEEAFDVTGKEELSTTSPFHVADPVIAVNAAFECYAEFGTEDDVPFFKEWLQTFPYMNPGHVGQTLSRMAPAEGAAAVIPLLRDQTPEVRQAAVQALFRIELGQVGISEEGVSYLGKCFDLGEYNNPQYRAERLTGQGEMGIFDEEGRLFKWFPLEGLTGDQETIKARIFDFSYETLFTPRADETPAEREEREGYLREFLEHYRDVYAGTFAKETGVSFSALSFKEQGHLLLFYRHADEATQARLQEFARTYGEDGLRSFLSLDRLGEEAGHSILHIGESYPSHMKGTGEGEYTARLIFKKYSELVLATDRVESYLQQQYKKWEGDYETARKVADSLLARANELITEVADTELFQEKGRWAEIAKKIRRITADVTLFKEVFRAAFLHGQEQDEPLELTDIEGLSIQSLGAEEVDNNDGKAMREIFLENRKNLPEQIKSLAFKEFTNEQQRKENTYYMLKHDKALLSFFAIRSLGKDRVLLTSFNTSPDMKGAAIGSFMLEQILERFSRDGITVEMKVNPRRIPMYNKYIENSGFTVERIIKNYEGTGEEVHIISRSPVAGQQKPPDFFEETVRQAA